MIPDDTHCMTRDGPRRVSDDRTNPFSRTRVRGRSVSDSATSDLRPRSHDPEDQGEVRVRRPDHPTHSTFRFPTKGTGGSENRQRSPGDSTHDSGPLFSTPILVPRLIPVSTLRPYPETGLNRH